MTQKVPMNAPASLSRSPFLLCVAALAASILTAACGTVVTDGGGDSGGGAGGPNGSGGSDPSGGGGGSSNPTGGGSSTAIAMLSSEIPPYGGGDPGDSGSSGTTSGGWEVDPNTLYIMLGDAPIACSDPYAGMDCGNHWSVTIGIPPALQVPGVIDLASPEIISTFSATGPSGGGDCYAAGGSFMEGTLEIVSIDDDQVVGVLANTAEWEFDADGQFSASRCF